MKAMRPSDWWLEGAGYFEFIPTRVELSENGRLHGLSFSPEKPNPTGKKLAVERSIDCSQKLNILPTEPLSYPRNQMFSGPISI